MLALFQLSFKETNLQKLPILISLFSWERVSCELIQWTTEYSLQWGTDKIRDETALLKLSSLSSCLLCESVSQLTLNAACDKQSCLECNGELSVVFNDATWHGRDALQKRFMPMTCAMRAQLFGRAAGRCLPRFWVLSSRSSPNVSAPAACPLCSCLAERWSLLCWHWSLSFCCGSAILMLTRLSEISMGMYQTRRGLHFFFSEMLFLYL